ncbi:MAG: spermidine/putrescine ABC transporter substrate-binding protein [Actinomycetota bacterium]|nr:spermidine/putrescine ABC transporter substrate-binding protein [Actinomycetota bacterium]
MRAEDAMHPGTGRRLSRRELIMGGARFSAGVSAAWMLAACGNGSSSSAPGPVGSGGAATGPQDLTGTATISTYPGWMGKNEIDAFRLQYPNADIKQVSGSSGATGSEVLFFRQNPGVYDFSLEDQSGVGQLLAGDLIEPIDWNAVPNISNVDESFRTAYAQGVPTDYGKVGIGYRTDLVPEGIKTWADVWNLAPNYSGQIIFLNLDRDCMGSALKYLGYSGNTTDQSEIDACTQALIQIKPHLQNITSTGVSRALVQGTAAIAMDWDYDIALAQQQEPRIQWVVPEEGVMAYLEGWVLIKAGPHLDVATAFMNFHLQPEQYADFVNTTGTAYVSSASTSFIDKTIAKNPILFPTPEILAKVEYENYLGEALAMWSKAWDEFKSA